MSNDTDFQRALETIIKGIVKGAICFEGTIKTVNSDYTCDVDVNKTVFYNVPVSVLKGKRSSFHLQPKVGTNCNLTFRDGNIQRPVITKIHEADKLFIDIEETIFNGGTHGMVKADSNTDRLNKIEKQLNNILNTLKTTVIPLAPSGTYPFASLYTSLNNLTETKEDDISDKKIKH